MAGQPEVRRNDEMVASVGNLGCVKSGLGMIGSGCVLRLCDWQRATAAGLPW